jgi:hypothetical protein
MGGKCGRGRSVLASLIKEDNAGAKDVKDITRFVCKMKLNLTDEGLLLLIGLPKVIANMLGASVGAARLAIATSSTIEVCSSF